METILAFPPAFLRATAAGHAGGIHDTPSVCRDGETVTGEPGPSLMQFGRALCAHDGSCPAGRIEQVAAPMGRGQPRTRRCLVR